MELTEMASDDNHIGENGGDDSEDNDVDVDDDVNGLFFGTLQLKVPDFICQSHPTGQLMLQKYETNNYI